ncbi:MAG: STAS domain-containing protein [Wenzhouxiangellaceae bacterium]|nr:STAS domain-containing protein [Wenzhouxiangellaceae bacterium]
MSSESGDTIRLDGRLTVDEVPQVYRQHLDWKANGLPSEIDLSGLEAADSSAVALLLEWLSWARKADKAIKFSNPPEALLTIAGLSQVQHLLGWEDSE